ncbi:MAG: class I SAM-dependent methyltransferase, partial [Paludibacteraceae bacterium]
MMYYLKYLRYLFRSKHRRGFGIHSPFVFHLVTDVIEETLPYYKYSLIEKVRHLLLKTEKIVFVEDFGTGVSGQRRISKIVRRSAKSKYYAQVLFRLVNYYKANDILELGTSFGLTTMYLAAPNSKSNVVTMEGCHEIAEYASLSFRRAGFDNIRLCEGNIDGCLPDVLKSFTKLDFVFFDANHKKSALLSYFDACCKKSHGKSVFVIDDIYWSDDMEDAWAEIKKDTRVRVTIDMFTYGIVLFDPELQKEDYVLRFFPNLKECILDALNVNY